MDENKEVQAYRRGRKQLVLFDEVNVGLMVERQIGETRALTGHVIRGANHKTYLEIHHEIRSVQSDTGAAEHRDACLVPFCHVASVATLQADQGSSRLGHAP